MGTLGAVRFSPSYLGRLPFLTPLPRSATPRRAFHYPRPDPCTLSECLFFFGIYSFHFGGLREPRVLNFWRLQSHLSILNQKKKKGWAGRLFPAQGPRPRLCSPRVAFFSARLLPNLWPKIYFFFVLEIFYKVPPPSLAGAQMLAASLP